MIVNDLRAFNSSECPCGRIEH